MKIEFFKVLYTNPHQKKPDNRSCLAFNSQQK